MGKRIHGFSLLRKINSYQRLSAMVSGFIIGVAILWSLFQLWFNSPLPYWLGVGIINDTQARAVHLMFAILLTFFIYPLGRGKVLKTQSKLNWVLAFIAAFCVAYIFIFYNELALRLGAPTTMDLIVGLAGIVLLLEGTRRCMGLPLPVIAVCALIYCVIGPYLPGMIAHAGASLTRLVTHQWLTTEGVFGVPLGVSTSFIFMFVLFGAMLERAGAGRYFITLAFALLGGIRGGAGKAAVLASALTGMISGSSIANVVTTGTFTIPMMERAGYTKAQSAAVVVASSTNGQLTPPIMGAAAFLMVEYLNIPYIEIIKHAILPALISYIALIYLVHLDALKSDMRSIQRSHVSPLKARLVSWGFTISGCVLVIGGLYQLLVWLPKIFGGWSDLIIIVGAFALYVWLLFYSRKVPRLQRLDVDALTELPPLGDTFKAGLYYLLPIGVLLWCLMIKQLSPGLSAFYGCLSLLVMMATRHFIVIQKTGEKIHAAVHNTYQDIKQSLAIGGYNMITIALATATAGIIVGTVSLTGVGYAFTEVIESISMGSLSLVLIFTALFCMLLGMGLPTTAAYIVVATLMVPAISTLAASHGLVIPLVAIHFFVFYFGIMADVTPPVGLASFAAAGIAGEDPMKTGVAAFAYSARTLLLPFIFIFNTELLLINIQSAWHLIVVATVSIVAMLVFVAGTKGYFIVRSRWYESVLLILTAFMLFRPDFWLNLFFPPYQELPATAVMQEIESLQPGDVARLDIQVTTDIATNERTYIFKIPEGPAADRLAKMGLVVAPEMDAQGHMPLTDITLFSEAEKLGLYYEDKNVITGISQRQPQPSKTWFYLPALVLLALLVMMQKRRKN